MKKVMVGLLMCLLVMATTSAAILTPSKFVTPHGLSKAYEVIQDLYEKGKIPSNVVDILSKKLKRAEFDANEDVTISLSFKGVLDKATLKINGNGSKLYQANSTTVSATNNSVVNLLFQYYPRDVKLKFEGYEWWSSNYQHIINGSGSVIASISETDGSFSVADDYTTNNPIWDSIGSNIIVNTSAGWLEHSADTVAETVSVIYNITIDDGTIQSLTWHNVSVYVAPNSTAGTSEDDLNVYYSTDGGTTWSVLFDASNGATSTGTQYTGDVSLPVVGNTSVLIKIEFVSDGADDVVGQADVYIDAINITGTVSKLPTRNPKLDVDNDGVYEYSYTGSLTNGTLSSEFSLGDLNLSNMVKVYCEGSEHAILNLSWYDEGRVHVTKVVLGGDEEDVNYFIAYGENATISFANFTDVVPPVTLTIVVDAEHTHTTAYNFTIELEPYAFMLMDGAVASISPDEGAYFQSLKSWSKPIPVFVKPRISDAAVAVNVYNPNATAGENYLNVTVSSSIHDNVVDFVLTDVPYDSLDLYVNGNYVSTLDVNNSTIYFNVTGFSTKDIALIPSGSLAAPTEEIDWQTVAAALIIFSGIAVAIWLLYATLRGR